MTIMSAALLLQAASLLLLPHYTLGFTGPPPDTCKYQGYTFQLLHTYVCLNYRLCYCQIDPYQLHLHSALNPTDPSESHRKIHNHIIKAKLELIEGDDHEDADFDFDSMPTTRTNTPLETEETESPTPPWITDVTEARPLFMEWRPRPPECACWCSGISYETRQDVLYRPEDTCIIDESDCYCDLERDLLWANQMRQV